MSYSRFDLLGRGLKLPLLAAALLGHSALAYAQLEPIPNALRTPYVTEDPMGMKLGINCTFERGKLLVHEEWSSGKTSTIEVSYQDILDVTTNKPLPGGKWSVMVQQKSGGIQFIPFNSQQDAKEVTEYLAKVGGLPSPRGAGAPVEPPRAPTPGPPLAPVETPPTPTNGPPPTEVSCPPQTENSCSSFKELLAHSDPEILKFMRTGRARSLVYGCFSLGGDTRFLIIARDLVAESRKRGVLQVSAFENGVEETSELATINWMLRDYAELSAFNKTANESGSISSSELQYRNTFPNVERTTTDYSLLVRWSTGKYVEKFSAPNKKNEVQLLVHTGYCVQLN